MAKVKDIPVHVVVETAERKRKCHRTKKHCVTAGHVCLVVRDGLYSRNYCVECATADTSRRASEVSQLVQQLGLISLEQAGLAVL